MVCSLDADDRFRNCDPEVCPSGTPAGVLADRRGGDLGEGDSPKRTSQILIRRKPGALLDPGFGHSEAAARGAAVPTVGKGHGKWTALPWRSRPGRVYRFAFCREARPQPWLVPSPPTVPERPPPRVSQLTLPQWHRGCFRADLSPDREARWSGSPTPGRGAGKPCEKSLAGAGVCCCVIPRVTTDARFPDGGLLFPGAFFG